ncbi:MAG: DUF4381 domain-containing protein [Pseudomonadota bacterium]
MTPEDAETEMTTLADLLDQLVSPPEPAPISMVPQTIGWPILALMVVALAGFLYWRSRQHRLANAYRQEALAALDVAATPTDVARILRQTALTAFPRTDVASLHGPDWLAFLDKTCTKAQFTQGPGQAIASAPYAPLGTLPSEATSAVRHWIAHHRTEGAR